MINWTQLKETVLFFESIIVFQPGITVRKPGITKCGNTSKQKASLQTHMATAVLIQVMTYKGLSQLDQ